MHNLQSPLDACDPRPGHHIVDGVPPPSRVTAERLDDGSMVRGLQRLRKMVDAFCDDADVRDAIDHLEKVTGIYIQRGTLLVYPPFGYSFNQGEVEKALLPVVIPPKFVSVPNDIQEATERQRQMMAKESPAQSGAPDHQLFDWQDPSPENPAMSILYDLYWQEVSHGVQQSTDELPCGVPLEFAKGELLTYEQFVERYKEFLERERERERERAEAEKNDP